MRLRTGPQRGFTLVETAIAVALLAVIVISVLSAFSAITIASNRHQEQASLDLLVRSDAEYIKSQPYAVLNVPPYNNLSPSGYSITYTVQYWDPNGQNFNGVLDQGLQEIVLTARAPHGGTETLRFLKVQP
jgi:prepilin-type N-terminal cleavage/methylation domain-containing protein